jgi:hypothetical protein
VEVEEGLVVRGGLGLGRSEGQCGAGPRSCGYWGASTCASDRAWRCLHGRHRPHHTPATGKERLPRRRSFRTGCSSRPGAGAYRLWRAALRLLPVLMSGVCCGVRCALLLGFPPPPRPFFAPHQPPGGAQCAQAQATQFPGVLVGRWTPPPFESAIKWHQKSTSNSAGSPVGSLALGTPPGHPTTGWCGRGVVPVPPLLLCTRPARARPSVGGQSPPPAPR